MLNDFYKISKADAARRQLDTAIKLYFSDADFVSIHTLGAAAHEILMKLGGKSFSLFSEKVNELIREDKKKIYYKKISEAKNFFKHAHKTEIRFNPSFTEYWLWEDCIMYQSLYGEMTDHMRCFYVWFLIHHEEIITDPKYKQTSEELNMKSYSRLEFAEIFFKALRSVANKLP